MEELKLLIDMVTHLPVLAVWVLVGYLVYKVVVLSSIYGVIRLVILKLHDWATKPVTTTYTLGGKAISPGVEKDLSIQIQRLSKTAYIHASDVRKLEVYLDKLQAEGIL